MMVMHTCHGDTSQSDSDSPGTTTRIDANSAITDRPTLRRRVSRFSSGAPHDHHGQSDFFGIEPEEIDDDLDGFVAAVTTIEPSQCERATDYAVIETVGCQLPIDRCTLATHDSLAPYSGLYPMARQVRAVLIEESNGRDDTALHDYLRANPSLHRGLGFETLPDQSTFWRVWNERFSAELRDTVQECADSIVTAARACGISLPERVTIGEVDETQSADCPEHQLLVEKTDEMWQQAEPFVADTFAPKRGSNRQIHENVFWVFFDCSPASKFVSIRASVSFWQPVITWLTTVSGSRFI